MAVAFLFISLPSSLSRFPSTVRNLYESQSSPFSPKKNNITLKVNPGKNTKCWRNSAGQAVPCNSQRQRIVLVCGYNLPHDLCLSPLSLCCDEVPQCQTTSLTSHYTSLVSNLNKCFDKGVGHFGQRSGQTFSPRVVNSLPQRAVGAN